MPSIHETRELISIAEIEFQCSRCQAVGETDALTFKTIDKLYGLMTVWVTYETVLKCAECDATYTTSVHPDKLCRLTPEEISRQFKVRVGLVEKFLVVAGWITLLAPPLSLILFFVARFMVPTAATRWRKAANIGVILSGMLLMMFVIMMTIGAWQNGK